jgi:hypothetical protein
METYHSIPKTPVTAEKEYLSTITLNKTHYIIENLVFAFHTLKLGITIMSHSKNQGLVAKEY